MSQKNQRIELHLHTKYSDMDSVIDVEDAILRPSVWEHKAVAITDFNSVQAFPEAAIVAQKTLARN